MTTLTFSIKEFFFDREKVAKALTKANKKALSKAGAFVRTAARGSLRRRKKPSSPGQTPSIHSKDKNRTLKKILFGYDPATESVIVGPVGFGKATAPHTLEKGGQVSVRVKSKHGNSGRKATPRQAAAFKRRLAAGMVRRKPIVRKVIAIEARPYMNPALHREYPKFPELWAGSVK